MQVMRVELLLLSFVYSYFLFQKEIMYIQR
jgi:hypothetical protein